MITLITGNANKYDELKAIFGEELVQKNIDLTEIQTLDVHEVIAAKLLEARKYVPEGELLVDDSGYYFNVLGKFPGVFSKFFLNEVGLEKTHMILSGLNNVHATAYTVLGYMDENNNILYSEGAVNGIIVSPRGNGGFGFDPVFIPDGGSLTFAEMSAEERLSYKMRTKAAKAMREKINKMHF